MKQIKTRFGTVLAIALFSLSMGMQACSEDDDDEDRRSVEATLNGANERPTPATTQATATIAGTYNESSKQLIYTLQWNNLTAAPNAMHYHGPAGPEEVAPPVKGITGFPTTTTATFTDTLVLTADEETQLLTGKWYFNIHTPTYPGGEVRGQVSTR